MCILKRAFGALPLPFRACGQWLLLFAFWLSVKNYLKIRVVSLSLSNSS